MTRQVLGLNVPCARSFRSAALPCLPHVRSSVLLLDAPRACLCTALSRTCSLAVLLLKAPRGWVRCTSPTCALSVLSLDAPWTCSYRSTAVPCLLRVCSLPLGLNVLAHARLGQVRFPLAHTLILCPCTRRPSHMLFWNRCSSQSPTCSLSVLSLDAPRFPQGMDGGRRG